MAFTRKFLTALGIEADKIDEIINAHVEVVEGLKEERDTFKKDAEKLAGVQKQLDDANDKLAKHSEDGETVPKSEYEDLKKQYEDYKTEQTTKETRQAKERAVREMYKAIGISEKRIDSVMKVTNLDEIELDKDGKIKDAETRTETAKTEWADFIETTTTKGAKTATPPANNGGGKMTRADIYKRDENGKYVLSTSERQKALAENPELMN